MSLTKIGSIGINTGIAFAGVTTIVTLNTANDALSIGATVNVGSGITLGASGDIFATGVSTFSGNLKVGSGVTISPDGDGFYTGVVTATTFSGALAASSLTGALPAISAANLTNVPAANITGTLPAISGANLTNLDASDLASGTVPTARLGSGTASSSTFLRGDSSFQTVDTDLVSDTSPQLGGALDMNNQNITSNDSSGGGNNRIVLGSGADLNLYSDGTNVRYEGNNLQFKNANGDEFLAKMTNGGAVELYHDNSIRAETISSGFKVSRSVDDSSTTLKLENNSTANSTTPSVSIKVDLANGKNGGSIDFVRVSNYQSSAAADSAIVFKPAKNDTPTEVVRITEDYVRLHSNSSGIQFNSDTADANALDDYEEGNWTPTIISSGGGTSSYTTQQGRYVKIGRVVYVTCQIVHTLSGASGELRVGGVPFNCSSITGCEFIGSYEANSHSGNINTNIIQVVSIIQQNNNYIHFRGTRYAANSAYEVIGTQEHSWLRVSMFYETDS